MLGVFSSVKSIVPNGKKGDSAETEPLVSKLHYRATVLLLFGSCCLVTALDWIANGRSISCIQDGPDDSWNIPPNVIDTYCYILSTFTLPSQLAGGTHPARKQIEPYPGVGSYNPKTDDVTFKSYYQWVPFVLFLQGCLFYAPHLLFKTWEGGKITGILCGLNHLILDRNERKSKEKVLASYILDNMHTHNIWAIKMYIAEVIYFLNIIGNIYLMDVFLGGEFRTYGWQVASMMQDDPEDRVDPMARIFPRVTKCTFRKFGASGSLQNHDTLCILPINIINEKIYVFLWFWLLILVCITVISMLYRLFILLTPSVRNMRLRSRVNSNHQERATQALDIILQRIKFGDWLLLTLLSHNMESLVFSELTIEMAEQLKENEQKQRSSLRNGRDMNGRKYLSDI